MNNKGFTLIELLSVIIILVVIFMLVYPNVVDIIKQSEDTTYQKQINTILSATYDFTLKNPSMLPDGNEINYVTLNELKYNGLIDSNFIDPRTFEPFPNDLVISISKVNSSSSTNNYSKKSGNYLYSVLIDRLEDNESKPTITLSGITADSDGNYVTTLNVLDELDEVTYTATDSEDNDITDKVIVTIVNNGNMLDRVSNTKAGIYYINYTVVDSLGYATNVVRSVIVVDNQAPTLTLPDDNEVALSATEYDLDNGVSCTDNSNICTIKHTGTITFGTAGKYIIEYKASDPSGNTTTKKRVITVK